MKISEQEGYQYLARRSWLEATIQQILKDLSWQNLELTLSTSPSAEEFQETIIKTFFLSRTRSVPNTDEHPLSS